MNEMDVVYANRTEYSFYRLLLLDHAVQELLERHFKVLHAFHLEPRKLHLDELGDGVVLALGLYSTTFGL